MRKMIFTLMVAAITINTFATENKKQFTLRLIAETAADDKAYVNFDEGFSTGFVTNEDAQKVQGTSEGIPVVYTITSDNVPCMINNYGTFTQNEMIPVGVNVDADGSYVFRIEDLGNFSPSSIIQLEDKLNSTKTVINNQDYVTSITAAENELGRFYLHVFQPATYTLDNANCSNTAGKVTIEYSPEITWTSVTLLDTNTTIVQTLTDVAGNFAFTNLAGGSYIIQYTLGTQFTATEQVNIESGAIVADITNTVTTVAVSQEVQFIATATNATDYVWYVSDGGTVTGIVNTYYTFYQTGNFSVVFSASNDLGCTATDTAYFSVEQTTGISSVDKGEVAIWTTGSKKVSVTVPQAQVGNSTIRIYNLLGVEVYSQPVTTYTSEISLSNVPNSYYIVSVGNSKDKRTQKVYLGNQ